MFTFNGERFYHASGAARFLEITRFSFYTNIKGKLTAYQCKGSRRKLYKEADLVPFRSVQLAS